MHPATFSLVADVHWRNLHVKCGTVVQAASFKKRVTAVCPELPELEEACFTAVWIQVSHLNLVSTFVSRWLTMGHDVSEGQRGATKDPIICTFSHHLVVSFKTTVARFRELQIDDRSGGSLNSSSNWLHVKVSLGQPLKKLVVSNGTGSSLHGNCLVSVCMNSWMSGHCTAPSEKNYVSAPRFPFNLSHFSHSLLVRPTELERAASSDVNKAQCCFSFC